MQRFISTMGVIKGSGRARPMDSFAEMADKIVEYTSTGIFIMAPSLPLRTANEMPL